MLYTKYNTEKLYSFSVIIIITMVEGDISKFNEAALKMRRIDILQADLHNYRLHPLRYNLEYEKYHYEIVFSLCLSLEMELLGYMSEKEEEDVKDLREEIQDKIDNNPPFEDKQNLDVKNKVLNKDKWKELASPLLDYERALRRLIHIHKLGSPTETEAGGYD